MTPTKRYAIKCSTEEQAEECNKRCKNFIFVYFVGEWENYREGLGYTVITYEEAKEKGLFELSGKDGELPQQEEDVIEKIMKQVNLYAYQTDRMIGTDVKEIENILRKYLSSKK